MKIELPQWYDLHAHFRQGDILPCLIEDHLKMGCAGIVAMPNTQPPVAKVFADDTLPYWSIEEYLDMLRAGGGDRFAAIIAPLYLTRDTTPAMIEQGAKNGVLRACKYYPPHGTTGAEHGCDFRFFADNGVFRAMEENGVILCVHGESHNMRDEDYFSRRTNAEEEFYREAMPRFLDAHPQLRIVAEHVTTKIAADLVRQADNLAATITPQHLLYTAGHLLRGFKYHLYCLPLIKFEEDRDALHQAATAPDNQKFFAGTDSAPHTQKMTPCGCAAGCYTGGIAPQLYAQAFEQAGLDLGCEPGREIFKKFLCLNGPAFYGLSVPEEIFTLENEASIVRRRETPAGSITPLPLGMQGHDDNPVSIPWSITT